ncbi:uncharacterized protein LOC132551652 [Ylistrum balloti]|uniref:uncharacterized protein LOC132551652 n=1 Tax=Ylistrum balloti TaxID=509963 RepID=UPI0029059700|nr:uncharacterized protein LOC132551652 [Ylistrum balloti]
MASNTRIPKRARSELMEFIRLDSPDAKEILRESQRTNLIEKNTERIFRTISMCLVRNTNLVRRYERRRKSLRDQGRKPKELEDRLLFAEESWPEIQKVCRLGPNCEKTRNVLGDSQFGLHLNRNYDILLRYTACTKAEGIRFLLVFKAMFGKVKSVTPNLTDQYQRSIEPTPNYDTHISVIKPDADMGICDAQDHNLAYLYEYDEETTLPSMSPSQILPFAVISLQRTEEKIIGPLRTPWSKLRKKRQLSSFNHTFKQQLSEEAHTTPISNIGVSLNTDLSSTAPKGKVADISVDNINACSKREITNSNSLDNVSTLASNKNAKRKSPKSSRGSTQRSVMKVSGDRPKSVEQEKTDKGPLYADVDCAQQDESDLQYTEYFCDPPLEQKSSDDTNMYLEIENSSPTQHASPPPTEPSSDKSLIIHRLKELEQEIQTKQRKLHELRQSRHLSARSRDSITSDEDLSVEDFVTEQIAMASKMMELSEESEQPLDLSKASTIQFDNKFKDESVSTTDRNVSIFTLDERLQQNAHIDGNHENEEMLNIQSNNDCSGITLAGNINKLHLKINVDSDQNNCGELNHDIPTPTLDEPQDMCWIDTAQTVVVSAGPLNKCRNNWDTRGSTVGKETDTEVRREIKRNDSVDSTSRSQTDVSMPSSSKKCSDFYENYIKKKKRTMADHFKPKEISNVSAGALQHSDQCNMIVMGLGDTENSHWHHTSAVKPNVSETVDQQPMEENEQSTNNVSPQAELCYYNNNCKVLNWRDPILNKVATLESESTNSNKFVPQANGEDTTQSSKVDIECIAEECYEDGHKKHEDIPDHAGPIQYESDKVKCSKIQRDSDIEDKHSVLASPVCDNNTSPSCDETSENVLNEMQVDPESNNCQSNARHNVDKTLSTDVKKALQDLGDAIKEIQKKVIETDDSKSSSIISSPIEVEVEMDTSLNTMFIQENQGQQAISTIVTDRLVRQNRDNATTKVPTVIEVSCVNMQKDVSENGAMDTDLRNECTSMLDVNDAVITPMKSVDSNTKSENLEDNRPIQFELKAKDKVEDLNCDDFTPKNQGFSSFLQDAGCQSGFEALSKVIFRDGEAIRGKNQQKADNPPIVVKTEAPDSYFDEKSMQMDSIEDDSVRKVYITNASREKERTAHTISNEFILSQEIEKTLSEIKNDTNISHQLYSPENSSFQEKEAKTIKLENIQLSPSHRPRSSGRSRSRSKSTTVSIASDLQRKSHYRPREVSPIRDPSFVPFHEKGKILKKYFKNKRKRFGLKWVGRKRSPSGFRVRAVHKAKLTLYKNFVSQGPSVKKRTDTRRVVKVEKRDSDANDRNSWKSKYSHKKAFFRNSSKDVAESKFQERGLRSCTNRQTVRPWHRTGTIPDNLIIDRHGMIISTTSQSNRSESRFRNNSRFGRRVCDESVLNKHQSTRRSFLEHSESTNRSDLPSSEATLSKAMTSLLKRVLFDGPRNDGSTEDKMADMIFEMMKRVTRKDNEQSSTLGIDHISREETRGFEELPVDYYPELSSAVRSDRSRDRSRSKESYSGNWERREVYIDSKSSISCDSRGYTDHRRSYMQTSDERKNHEERYYNRTENWYDRTDRNENPRFGDRFDDRGWDRGRERWDNTTDNFNTFSRSNLSESHDKRPFQRDDGRYSSRSFNLNASHLRTGKDFSSGKGFRNSDFHNQSYSRKFEKYASERKYHHRNRNRKSSRNAKEML